MPTHDPFASGYAGFWSRVLASIIDTVLLLLVMMPIVLGVYGMEYLDSTRLVEGPLDFVVSYVLPAIAVVVFWVYKESTPGKMMLGLRIVDATTGGHASTGQYLGRYFGYYVSLLPLGLGFLWVAWDPRKQGWHDMLSRTVVVKGGGSAGDRAR